jgi:hypothetical protein
MTRARKIRIGAVLAALSSSFATAADPPVREQFAYAAALEVPETSPVVALDLPVGVYRDCVDPALRDLRVLNGAGEVVPFALRRPAASPRATASPLHLPLFPLHGDPGAAAAALALTIDSGHTRVEVQGTGAQQAVAPITAWLVDAASIGTPIDSLEWEWPADATDFAITVLLEASDDLEHWRAIAPGAPLARLEHAGRVFTRNAMSFGPTRSKYWRVSIVGAGEMPAFTGVSATPVSDEVPNERLPAVADGVLDPGQPGDYLFDLGAQLPVDRVELELPDINTVAEAEFFARRRPDDAWQSVARGGIYRLRSASGELTSPPLTVSAQPRRYWRVRVNPRGGGIGQGVPRLRAGWLADRLVFVTRGAGPFELVYGRYGAAPADVALESLLPGGSEATFDVSRLPLARSFDPLEAGGPEMLEPPPPERPWRAWVLWISLLAGVATLGAVAWGLARQMREP